MQIPRATSLSAFVPHRTIPAGEVKGRQDVVFSIDLTAPTRPRFGINQRSYAPDRVDRLLPLGGTEEWHLTSTIAGHPFHIHVNPFQVVAVYKPLGNGERMDRRPSAMMMWTTRQREG